MTEEAGSFFQDETKSLRLTPKSGLLLDAQREAETPVHTPGTNHHKAWVSGALNFKTGRFHWVAGGRRNGELFIRLLDKLRRTYRCHKQLHLWRQTATAAT
jgi:putative transposase